MELEAQSRSNKQVEDKPSILALVNTREFRQSLKRIAEMMPDQRTKYASRFMEKYQAPLFEIGFDKESVGYRMFEMALATIQHAMFERNY